MTGLRIMALAAFAVLASACTTSPAEQDINAALSMQRLDASSLRYTNPTPPKPIEMDPSRKISEQECSKPVDLEHGNLLCK